MTEYLINKKRLAEIISKFHKVMVEEKLDDLEANFVFNELKKMSDMAMSIHDDKIKLLTSLKSSAEKFKKLGV